MLSAFFQCRHASFPPRVAALFGCRGRRPGRRRRLRARLRHRLRAVRPVLLSPSGLLLRRARHPRRILHLRRSAVRPPHLRRRRQQPQQGLLRGPLRRQIQPQRVPDKGRRYGLPAAAVVVAAVVAALVHDIFNGFSVLSLSTARRFFWPTATYPTCDFIMYSQK